MLEILLNSWSNLDCEVYSSSIAASNPSGISFVGPALESSMAKEAENLSQTNWTPEIINQQNKRQE